MNGFPYEDIKVDWKRPPIDPNVLRECTKRSDLQGLWMCLGTLALLTATGTWAYLMFAGQHWVWMAVALYVHGGLFAFNASHHELVHGTVFKTKWLNTFFLNVFDWIDWRYNSPFFKLSHMRHHQYTLHRRSDGEEVHPRAETTERVLQEAVRVVDLTALIDTIYDRIYSLCVPFLRNPRRSPWERYVYANATPKQQKAVFRGYLIPFAFHLIFDTIAIATGSWFLIVVVTLPSFYGGRWYHTLVHDTMHVGCEPETDDFGRCCRTTLIDPFSSFLFWHMEYHIEHHTYASVPCYRLKKLHQHLRPYSKPPMTLREAWQEMNRFSADLLNLAPAEPKTEPTA